jgi:hypothetical protein
VHKQRSSANGRRQIGYLVRGQWLIELQAEPAPVAPPHDGVAHDVQAFDSHPCSGRHLVFRVAAKSVFGNVEQMDTPRELLVNKRGRLENLDPFCSTIGGAPAGITE